MRNIFKLLCISLFVMLVTGFSCTKEKKPLCEQNHFGTVTVHNDTSIPLWVDATSEGEYYNDETRLAPGGSKKFTIDPGAVGIWAASDAARAADNWNYDEVYVDQCEEYTYTWTNKKGAEGNTYSDLNNGRPKK